uniref:Protein kinase domain-containing protein n=2 Tax=Triatoma infestans TaxID=30076 RepID=A0A023F2D9_TRIIF
MYATRKILKYAFFGSVTFGTIISFKANRNKMEDVGFVRFGRAALAATNIVLHYKRTLYTTTLDPLSVEYMDLKSKVHREAAEKLLELCCANKGVFIKVGQHIGALDYLLPHEYIETMRVLHSQAPSSSLNDVYFVIKEELKQDPSELFTEFSPEPIGTASLAQVHKAKLKDGSVVAVKVQHPSVKGNSMVDMATMEVLVMIASKIFPEFKIKWLVDESKKNIPRELDFTEEAANTKKAKDMYKHFHWLKVPDVYDDLSTERVLTMEYVEGGQVNDVKYMVDNGIDTFEVSDKLGLLYSEMIFRKGYVHSDPHPGNILVSKMPNGEASIILLDHGLYAHLSDKVRNEYSGLWLSILDKDMEGMKKHSEALGVGSLYGLFACMVSGRSWTAIESGITVTKHSFKEKEEFQLNIPKFLAKISETLALVNKEMLLILKTNDLLRGIEFTLKTQNRMSSFIIMSKCCIQCVYECKMNQCTSFVSRCKNTIAENWSLLKVMLYYFYLSIKTLSVKSALKNIMYMY